MRTRFEFNGTGGELFKRAFVGFLLTTITFGIYAPWYIVSIVSYLAENTVMHGARGPVRFSFVGTGGELFKKMIVGGLLTMITFGIYSFWLIANLQRFYIEGIQGKASDGTTYGGTFTMTGGQLFKELFVGALLCGITFGIYAFWFVPKMQKVMSNATVVKINNRQAGTFDFDGTAGNMFKVYFVSALLTMITFGIYGPWAMVKINQYFLEGTTVTVDGVGHRFAFNVTGGEMFKRLLIDAILTPITLGIWTFWSIAKSMKLNLEGITAQSGASALQTASVQGLRAA